MGRPEKSGRPNRGKPRPRKRGKRSRNIAVLLVGVIPIIAVSVLSLSSLTQEPNAPPRAATTNQLNPTLSNPSPIHRAAGILHQAGYLLDYYPSPSSREPQRAAIVDQLSLTFPNRSFVEKATEVLEQGGYAVDYYPGREVTVQFFQNLPRHGYDVILLRVHSAQVTRRTDGRITFTDEIGLFTSEPYASHKHDKELKARRLTIAHYVGTSEYHFGITPAFIRSRLKDGFDNAIVILMGCDTLKYPQLAVAFYHRGAGAVIGWSGPVSAPHTDAATERLLHYMLVESLPPAEAVVRVGAEVGQDPAYGGRLFMCAPPDGPWAPKLIGHSSLSEARSPSAPAVEALATAPG